MANSPQRAPSYRFGIYEVFPESGELFRQGQRVKIQEQPFRLLILLLEQPGEVVSREWVSQRLWPGDTFVEFDQSLGAAVMKLRQALRDDADNPRFIETIPRRGFRFIAPMAHPPEGAGENASDPERQKEQAGRMAESRGGGLSRGWLALLFALVAVIVVVVVGSQALVQAPPAKVLATSQVTHDGIFKEGLLTDGSRLYLMEKRGGGNTLVQASVSEGETIPISTPFPFISLQNISADGSELLATSLTPTEREGEAWTLRMPGGAPSRVGNVMDHGAAWSRDGRELVFAKGSDLFLARADGTEQHKLIGISGTPFDPSFSLDGRRIRFGVNASDNTSAIWEVRSDGTELHAMFPSLQRHSSQCCGVWTADGRYYVFVASTGGAGNIWARREPASFLERRDSPPVQLTTGPLSFGALAPSPSGGKLYAEASQSRGELVRYDAKSKQFVPFLSGMSAGEANFSRDAQWITYISYPEGTLWRSRADGSERLQLTRPPLFAVLPRWSPDGTQIAFAGAELGKPWTILVVPAGGGVPSAVCAETRGETDASWSPDGKQVAFGRLPTTGVSFSRVARAGST